jgi:cell shape-determining protein MreC
MNSLKTIGLAACSLLSLVAFLIWHEPFLAWVRSLRSSEEKVLVRALALENQRLRAGCAASATLHAAAGVIEAAVHSRYPFNDRHRITIARGSVDGVSVGMPVLAAPGVLLGVVVETHRRQSEAQTIFDPSWNSSVMVGEVKAVLRGGSLPWLDLIPESERISEGDSVRNIDPAFPYGVFLGEVGVITRDSQNSWQRAALRVGFKSEDLTRVLLMVEFP